MIPASNVGGSMMPGAVTPQAEGLKRRSVLLGFAGLAAAPLLSKLDAVDDATSALARRFGGATAAPAIARGGHARFNAPALSPGHRIRLPEGTQIVARADLADPARPTLTAAKPDAWPKIRGGDGATIDLSTAPKPGAPSQMLYLTGFSSGWYEIADPAGGKPARVEWDADELPYLWLWQEWGASTDYPYFGKFYAVGLEPFSSYPGRV